jgi:FtsZ-interacting cell division protein YlmF
MMKLKDEGIVKPLKDSIFRNERLSSQEQQELCAWIECAMDFGENLDECVEKLAGAERTRNNLVQLGFPTFQSCREYADKISYAKTIIQDLLNNSDEYARQRAMDFLKGE